MSLTLSRWPAIDEIDVADVEQLLRWNRELGSPRTTDDQVSCARVVARLHEEQERSPGEYVAASKRVGWAVLAS